MNARTLVRRAAAAVLVHALLLLAWPLLGPLYAPAYRTLGEVTLTVVHPWPDWLRVRLVAGASGALTVDQVAPDTTVSLEHRELKGAGTIGASSFFHGWQATSVLLALFLAATPLAWRARWKPFLWALLWLHLFLLARLVVAVTYTYSQLEIEDRPILTLSPFGLRALRLAWHVAWSEMFTNYLAPLAIWALCAFDRRSRAG